MKAYKAAHIYFDEKIYKDAFMLAEEGVIKGISITPPSCEVEEFGSSGIFPSFINTHTHLPMSLFRGIADDLPLDIWLRKYIWPLEKKWLSSDFVRDATRLAICELIHTGTSLVSDMYFWVDVMAEEFTKAGLRAILCPGVMDFASPHASNPQEYLEKTEALIYKYKNELVDIGIAPHAAYTASPSTYRLASDFARKHDTLLHTHLAETKWENEEVCKRHGKRSAALMLDSGALDCKSLFAHVVHINDEERLLLGEKKAGIAHCIQSNFKLGSGYADMGKLGKLGAVVSLGTDGNASNNDLSMFNEMFTAFHFHKKLAEENYFDEQTLFRTATREGAKALHKDNLGTLKEGNSLDFMVIKYDKGVPESPFEYIINSDESKVSCLFVNGRCLMKDGALLTIDEEEALDRARYWQKKLAKEI